MKAMILVLILIAFSYSDTFNGKPWQKCITSENGVVQKNIDLDIQDESKVVISKDEMGVYIWKSRNDTQMDLQTSGIFMIFTAKTGAGYVKINTETGDYIEHMHLELKTVTYYGRGTFSK